MIKDAGRVNGHHIYYEDSEDARKGIRYFEGLSEEEAEELFKRAREKKGRNYFKGDYDRKFSIRYSSSEGKFYLEKYEG